MPTAPARVVSRAKAVRSCAGTHSPPVIDIPRDGVPRAGLLASVAGPPGALPPAKFAPACARLLAAATSPAPHRSLMSAQRGEAVHDSTTTRASPAQSSPRAEAVRSRTSAERGRYPVQKPWARVPAHEPTGPAQDPDIAHASRSAGRPRNRLAGAGGRKNRAIVAALYTGFPDIGPPTTFVERAPMVCSAAIPSSRAQLRGEELAGREAVDGPQTKRGCARPRCPDAQIATSCRERRSGLRSRSRRRRGGSRGRPCLGRCGRGSCG